MASELISARREEVQQSVNAAKARNRRMYADKDPKATSEYIYPNQAEDAMNIINMFYTSNRRVIVVQKKTKVGADGLMIELLRLATTHNDEDFIVNVKNVRIITGMSNISWQDDMIEKSPDVFRDKIYHHGQLSKADLSNMKDSLIIIDEIDTGDKERQKLHTLLHDAKLLDIKHLEENNIRFVFISATILKQIYELFQWGDLHERYKMTIPDNYIGHKEFHERGIIQEFYPLNTKEKVEQWIQEDILDNYGNDYRVHIVRLNPKGKTNNELIVRNACIHKGVLFKIHTSADRLSAEEINELFEQPLTQHIVLGVIGFYRRANLIPNKHKLRIGATHELYTKVVDINVQIQGLPGRMTGYWKDVIDSGHKTGPYRTSVKAIQDYEKSYEEPFGTNPYQTNGFNKKETGKVTAGNTMLSPKNVKNLNSVPLPNVKEKFIGDIEFFKHSNGFADSDKYIREKMKGLEIPEEKLQTKYYFGKGSLKDENGFIKCALFGKKSQVHTLEELRETKPWIQKSVEASFGRTIEDAEKRGWAIHLYYGYEDVKDINSCWYAVRWIRKNV